MSIALKTNGGEKKLKMRIDELDAGESNVDTGVLARVARAQLAVSAANLKPCHGDPGRTAESNHPSRAHHSRNASGYSPHCSHPQPTAHPRNANHYSLIAERVNIHSPLRTLTIATQTNDSAVLTYNPFVIKIKFSATTSKSLIPLHRKTK